MRMPIDIKKTKGWQLRTLEVCLEAMMLYLYQELIIIIIIILLAPEDLT
jgi:hypothetical protein